MRGKSNVIKRYVEKVWDARYTLGARYLPKNTVLTIQLHPVVYCTVYHVTLLNAAFWHGAYNPCCLFVARSKLGLLPYNASSDLYKAACVL
jgi:hypothetical protein